MLPSFHLCLQEEPITGMREIVPKSWQKKTKWKRALIPVNLVNKEEDEDDLDGLGIQEATEMDDDEFHPGYMEGEETEEEYDQALDDEDWTMNKQGGGRLYVLPRSHE